MSQEYEQQKIMQVDLEREMKKSYIDYAMSVIVGRALPDVRDGLKPVHRRILYAMYEDGLTSDKPYRKSATTVGNVLGRYHPHGDASVYDAMVRMAQPFSLHYPLIDGHGNFGSVDGDPPAAYRYTEARMAKLANYMLADIKKNTVDFQPNFDEERQEPVVLPSRFPNLLVNGSSGIAVGMATNIPPHNLSEVIDGTCYVIDHPEAELDEICQFIKGPDFPTGGVIMGRSGIRAAYATGRGKIKVRAKTEIVDLPNGKSQIVITEIPYMVNKARLVESMANLVKDKRVEGITNIQDQFLPRGHADRRGRSPRCQRAGHPQPAFHLFSVGRYHFDDPYRARSGRGRQIAAARADPAPDPRSVYRLPEGRCRAPHALRPQEGARPCAHSGGPQGRDRQYRPHHRHHPRV